MECALVSWLREEQAGETCPHGEGPGLLGVSGE